MWQQRKRGFIAPKKSEETLLDRAARAYESLVRLPKPGLTNVTSQIGQSFFSSDAISR